MPVGGLRVELAGDGAQLVAVGQDEVARPAQVVRGGAGGQERRPRLGRLAQVALLEAREVVPQLLGGQ